MSRIEQSGRMSLRRPNPAIKGGSAPEEEEKNDKSNINLQRKLVKYRAFNLTKSVGRGND